MKRAHILTVIPLLLTLTMPVVAQPQLRIAAAISLRPLFEDVLAIYRSSHQVSVSITYGASGSLARQISQGAPIDLFVSGAPQHLDPLDQAHLTIPGTRSEVARGRLVLVTPLGTNLISTFEDLGKPQVKRVAIGDPKTVPLGSYALDILSTLRLAPGINHKLMRTVHARQALLYVETGDVDAGIVYRSDALSSPRVRIAAAADPTWLKPVRYEAVILKGTKTRSTAETFLQFLSSPAVYAALLRHGLDQPSGRP